MTRKSSGHAAGRPLEAQGEATRAKVREVVESIAAAVIAETAERLGKAPRREAAALRMARRTISGPRLGSGPRLRR
jgi:hypothetical protein